MPRSGPNPKSLSDAVAAIIARIRPAVQADGGDIEFVDLDDAGRVRVRLHGACIGCPSAEMTLRMGVERALRDELPQIREVVCV